MPDTPHRISARFADIRSRNATILMPFIPAGYPDLDCTAAAIRSLDRAGAGLIEIGFPFSDPIADGPTIQAAFTEALAKKLKVADIFNTIAKVRPDVTVPLVAMVSYSIVYRYGVDLFFTDAAAAGFDGVILPDLPPPEAEPVCKKAWAAGLDTVLLVSPTTDADRRAEIARLSTGFIYYLSVAGVTGERDSLPVDLPAHVAAVRALTDRPVCVGFGIHTPVQVRDLSKIADGVIVGSAMVKRMTEAAGQGPHAVAAAVAGYCMHLMTGT
jgi:tryptophan synthase alpha chain